MKKRYWPSPYLYQINVYTSLSLYMDVITLNIHFSSTWRGLQLGLKTDNISSVIVSSLQQRVPFHGQSTFRNDDAYKQCTQIYIPQFFSSLLDLYSAISALTGFATTCFFFDMPKKLRNAWKTQWFEPPRVSGFGDMPVLT